MSKITPALSAINGGPIAILNAIRNQASPLYQANVPAVSDVGGIVSVGQSLANSPDLQNEFIGAVMNRIGQVVIKNGMFDNYLSVLKKGILNYGTSVEEVFIEMATVRGHSRELAPAREFARTIPEVHAQFHVLNWSAQYPITVYNQELNGAFLSEESVMSFIDSIVGSLIRTATWHEFLLAKYQVMKAAANGGFKTILVDDTDPKSFAKASRSTTRKMAHISRNYNVAGVRAATSPENQIIFLDSDTEADQSVEVIAQAFNMSAVQLNGQVFVLDDFINFPDEEFDEINSATEPGTPNIIEPFSAAELAILAGLRAVVMDRDWFQLYDRPPLMTSTTVASGNYNNFFLWVRKIIANSDYANAAAFFSQQIGSLTLPATLVYKVTGLQDNGYSKVYNLELAPTTNMALNQVEFVQTEPAVAAGIAVQPYGQLLVPDAAVAGLPNSSLDLVLNVNGAQYGSVEFDFATAALGETVTFTQGT